MVTTELLREFYAELKRCHQTTVSAWRGTGVLCFDAAALVISATKLQPRSQTVNGQLARVNASEFQSIRAYIDTHTPVPVQELDFDNPPSCAIWSMVISEAQSLCAAAKATGNLTEVDAERYRIFSQRHRCNLYEFPFKGRLAAADLTIKLREEFRHIVGTLESDEYYGPASRAEIARLAGIQPNSVARTANLETNSDIVAVGRNRYKIRKSRIVPSQKMTIE